MNRHQLRKDIECNRNNIAEARKLPRNRRRDSYIKRTILETDALVRNIGRDIAYVKLNKDAYKQGEDWLEKQGVIL